MHSARINNRYSYDDLIRLYPDKTGYNRIVNIEVGYVEERKLVLMVEALESEYDLKLWALLFRAAYAIRRARERELQSIGINWVQSSVLHHIKIGTEPPTPADLARALFRKAHTMSELIKRMEAQGLVKRARDLKRRNVIRVQLTDKGEKAYLQSRHSRVIHEILSSLDNERRNLLFKDLRELFNKSVDLLNKSYSGEYMPMT